MVILPEIYLEMKRINLYDFPKKNHFLEENTYWKLLQF